MNTALLLALLACSSSETPTPAPTDAAVASASIEPAPLAETAPAATPAQPSADAAEPEPVSLTAPTSDELRDAQSESLLGFRVEEGDLEQLPELTDESVSAQDLNTKGFIAYKTGDLWLAAQYFTAAVRRDDSHSLAHYNAACTMALIRALDGPCGVMESYRSVLLGHLEKAAKLDESRKTRMMEDPDLVEVRDMLRFRLIAGADLEDPVALGHLLALTTWSDPPMGAYGSLKVLKFSTNGTFTTTWTDGAKHVMEEPLEPLPQGTWKLEGTTLTMTQGGQTETLTIEPTGNLREGDEPIPAWTEDPSECDA